ncbi:MAG: substrate binding domain-containing protein, partial [Perlucidibaca sp.]
RFMGSVVAEFMQQHPAVSLEAELSSRLVDLVEEGVDLGLRIGEFNDANLIGRRLGQLCGRFYASPEYIAQHGMPASPEALAGHDFVLFRQARENQFTVCHAGADGGRLQSQVSVKGRLTTNNSHLMMDAVCAGLGVGLLPGFLTDQAVSAGRLVPVLPDSLVRLGDLWAMTPSRTHMSSALRAFLDFLAERMREHPWFTS